MLVSGVEQTESVRHTHISTLIYLFIFWLRWVFVAVRGLSLVAARGGTLRCGTRTSHCGGFSCCGARALGCTGFSCCGAWAQ